MDPLHWVFIVTALTLTFVVFAVNPLQVGIDEALRSNAELQAQRIASTINLVASAPDGTTYTLELPDVKCKINITSQFVTMRSVPAVGIELQYTISVIKTSTQVIGGNFDCKQNTLHLRKSNGVLTITNS